MKIKANTGGGRGESAPARRVRRGAFSLVELLVAVLLLSISVAAITTLWNFSRKVTERSRDWAEYYVVARQEAERGKNTLFKQLFISSGNIYSSGNNPHRTDYDQKGLLLATNLAAGAAVTANAYYRVVSTYSLVATGAETDNTRKLGVQKIQVYRKSTATAFEGTPIYQTCVFYSSPGV
jgi:type II secretory pathway pseudopilin PulG